MGGPHLGADLRLLPPLGTCPALVPPGALVVRGKRVVLAGVYPSPFPAMERGKRSVITSFSWDSRKRLMNLMASMDDSRKALFVTLTYGESWPGEPLVWKRHLDSFWKAVARRYPGASAVWKLERQARGAPHYHLLVWGVPFLPHEWAAAVWGRVTGDESAKHLAAGVEVRALRSHRGAMHYTAKYVAKVDDFGLAELARAEAEAAEVVRAGGVSTVDFAEERARLLERLGPWVKVGRWWGVLGRESLPLAPERSYPLPSEGPVRDVALRVVRAIRDKHRESKGKESIPPETPVAQAFCEPSTWAALVRSEAEAEAASLVKLGKLRPLQVPAFVAALVASVGGGLTV